MIPAVVSAAELASVNCAIALSNWNKLQEASALKEMKRCENAAIVSGTEPGAVVTLKVDYRMHSHAQGLIAIIFDVKKTGGNLSVLQPWCYYTLWNQRKLLGTCI